MKNVFLLLLFFSGISCYGQVISSSKTPDPEEKALKVMADSGSYFKTGLTLLANNQKQLARKEFDKSIETFLVSGISLKDNAALNNCHINLIETIYRLEFAQNSDPQFLLLSQSCNWKLDGKTTSKLSPNKSKPESRYGFTEQAFEASPLDELANLKLKTEEETEKDTKKFLFLDAINGSTVKDLVAGLGVDPEEIAGLNGVKVSTKLVKNQKILVPIKLIGKYNVVDMTGIVPSKLRNGSIPAVTKWFNEHAHDPYSLRIVRWGKLQKKIVNNYKYWTACVKFRAKNTLGAYTLSSTIFYFVKGKVVSTQQTSDCIQ